MNASETHAAVQTAIVPARLSANGTHRTSDELLPVAAMTAPRLAGAPGCTANASDFGALPFETRVGKGAKLGRRLEGALWAPSESSVFERALKLFSGSGRTLYACKHTAAWKCAWRRRLALRERSRHHFEFAVSALNFLRSPPFDATDQEKRSTRGTPVNDRSNEFSAQLNHVPRLNSVSSILEQP